ncbi:MAG: hypothetical protein QNJ16_11555 [Rhodobacter sp.]|nr:hypothetical protein [Rhodobacter sp.]
MHESDPSRDLMQRVRNVVDWAVFTVGVLSLSAAITATILTKTELFGAEDADQTPLADRRNL